MKITKYFEFIDNSSNVWKIQIKTILKSMLDGNELTKTKYDYIIGTIDSNFASVLNSYGKMSASAAVKALIDHVDVLKYESNLSKYLDFINEDNFQDTPEEYIKIALMKLKKKIDSLFEEGSESDSEPEDQISTMSQAKKRGEEKEKKESEMSFADLKIKLESSEISKYSAIYDSLSVKFSDEEFRYDLYITIPLTEGISKDKTKDFSDSEIKQCSYKFKKYDINNDFELVGQLGPKTVDISKIDEDFLVSLKIELDDEFGDEEEGLEIET